MADHREVRSTLVTVDFSVIPRLEEEYKAAFRLEMLSKGIVAPDVLVIDGKLHRFNLDDGDKKVSGWYVLHPSGNGQFGSWKTNVTHHWRASGLPAAPSRASNDHDLIRSRVDKAKTQQHARSTAIRIWNQAARASANFQYLKKKQIGCHNARQSGGSLLIAMRDIEDQLQSIHFIDQDGHKKNLPGASTKGLFCRIGPKFGEAILIAEGFATAASASEATGLPAVVAFSAANLSLVGAALRGRYPRTTLIFVADNDIYGDRNVGKEAATEAARSVGGVVALPAFDGFKIGANKKLTDVNDLACVAGVDAVRELIDDAIARKPGLCALDHESFLAQKFPPRELMLSPWLPTQSLTLLYAPRGMGKTFVSLGVAYAVAAGRDFLRWPNRGRKRKVLFVDGEMPATVLQNRLALVKGFLGGEAPADALRIISPDLQPNGIPDLATPHGRDILDSMIGDAQLVILDNLSSLYQGSGRENDSEMWAQLKAWIIRKRSVGVSVLLIHHAGKNVNSGPRGYSGIEDVLDTTIALKKPSDYKEGEGARFNLVYTKNRGFWGVDAKPFEVKILSDRDGKLSYVTGACTLFEDAVIDAASEGLSQRDIGKKLGISASTVNRILRDAGNSGRGMKGAAEE